MGVLLWFVGPVVVALGLVLGAGKDCIGGGDSGLKEGEFGGVTRILFMLSDAGK